MSVIHPALRKAAADARVLAVSCLRHAQAKDTMDSPEGPSQVEAAIKSETAVVSDKEDEELHFADLIVRLKPFRSFFDSTPAGVLPHPLCAHRFCHRLHHAYGKKVQTLAPPFWLKHLIGLNSSLLCPQIAHRSFYFASRCLSYSSAAQRTQWPWH